MKVHGGRKMLNLKAAGLLYVQPSSNLNTFDLWFRPQQQPDSLVSHPDAEVTSWRQGKTRLYQACVVKPSASLLDDMNRWRSGPDCTRREKEGFGVKRRRSFPEPSLFQRPWSCAQASRREARRAEAVWSPSRSGPWLKQPSSSGGWEESREQTVDFSRLNYPKLFLRSVSWKVHVKERGTSSVLYPVKWNKSLVCRYWMLILIMKYLYVAMFYPVCLKIVV